MSDKPGPIVWEKTGRKVRLLDEKTGKPTRKVIWQGRVGEENVQDEHGTWQPFIYDSLTNSIKYGGGQRLECQSDKQVFKDKENNEFCKSFKFFIQKEVDGTWKTISHGLPTRKLLLDKRFLYGKLVEDEGYAIQQLSFPDAPYNLSLYLQAGRSRMGIFGFEFSASESGKYRFQIVNDGLKGPIELIRNGAPKTGGVHVVGFKWSSGVWRWTFAEAKHRTVEIDDSKAFPTLKKTIVNAVYDYVSGEKIKVLPDTFTSSEADDWCHYSTTMGFSQGSSDIRFGKSYYNDDYNVGLTWDNVTVPAGATAEDGCKITIYSNSVAYGSGLVAGELRALDYRDVPAFSSSVHPPNMTKHAASVSWSESGSGTQDSPEIKTLIQARLDDDHASGDEIGISGITPDGSQSWIAFDSPSGGNGPVLTIVYTDPLSLTQEGYRVRNDDGTETTATWKAAQDIAATGVSASQNVRLRTLIDVSGDAPSQTYKLQYKRNSDAASEWRDVPEA